MHLKMFFTLTYMSYCESDILYQESMLHTLELLSCFEYQLSAKMTKMAQFQLNFENKIGW